MAESLQGGSADTFHQHGRKIIAAIGVRPGIARRVIERALAADNFENVRVGILARATRPAGDVLDFAPIAEAAGVVKELPHGDGAFIRRDFGEIFADVAVEIYLPVFHQ